MFDIRKKILELLKDSTVNEHLKRMTELLLPTYSHAELKTTYETLVLEKKKMLVLNAKERMLEMKYQAIMEKVEK